MSHKFSQRTADEISRRLADLLGVPMDRIAAKVGPSASGDRKTRADLLVLAGGFKCAVEWKGSGSAAAVAMAVRSVRRFVEKSREKLIPLVATPYIGEVGQRLCQEAGVGWLDLSGNAHLVGPGLRVNIEGKPNRFKRPGRPRSSFAPKSSRIARRLLIEPKRAFSQRELAKVANLDEGFTSRIVRQLQEQRLVAREESGAVKVADYDALLEAWREAYDFSKHEIARGHVAARSGDDALRHLTGHLKEAGTECSATGLAGAWLLDKFAGFRLVVLYVKRLPALEAQQAMGFREESRGENVWLVVPNDEGVFHGAAEREGIRCAHPVQVYLDLKNHPERAVEAAERLRKNLLSGANHA